MLPPQMLLATLGAPGQDNTVVQSREGANKAGRWLAEPEPPSN